MRKLFKESCLAGKSRRYELTNGLGERRTKRDADRVSKEGQVTVELCDSILGRDCSKGKWDCYERAN
jgi:hypothetical protein